MDALVPDTFTVQQDEESAKAKSSLPPPPAPDPNEPKISLGDVRMLLKVKVGDSDLNAYDLLCRLASLSPEQPQFKLLVAHAESVKQNIDDIDLNLVASTLAQVESRTMIMPEITKDSSPLLAKYSMPLCDCSALEGCAVASILKNAPSVNFGIVDASPILPSSEEYALLGYFRAKSLWYPNDSQNYPILRAVLVHLLGRNGIKLSPARLSVTASSIAADNKTANNEIEEAAYALINDLPRAVNTEALLTLKESNQLNDDRDIRSLLNQLESQPTQSVEQGMYSTIPQLATGLPESAASLCQDITGKGFGPLLATLDSVVDGQSIQQWLPKGYCIPQLKYLLNVFKFFNGKRIRLNDNRTTFIVKHTESTRELRTHGIVNKIKSVVSFDGDYSLFRSHIASLTLSPNLFNDMAWLYQGNDGIISATIAANLLSYYMCLNSHAASMYQILSALPKAELLKLDKSASSVGTGNFVKELCSTYKRTYTGDNFPTNLCQSEPKVIELLLAPNTPTSIKNIIYAQRRSPTFPLGAGIRASESSVPISQLACNPKSVKQLYTELMEKGLDLSSSLIALANCTRWNEDKELGELVIKIQQQVLKSA